MKKFLILIFAMVTTLVFTACQTQFGLVYGVQLTGDGDGQFEVTFPQGSYAMDGKAALALNVGDSILFNDTTQQVTYKSQVLARGNKKELAAMKRVNDSIAANFEAFAGEGTYDLWLKGFVKEIGTGLVFSVDRHLTNRDAALRKSPAVESDEYPFIR
jgi:hypothetical protein